MKHLNASLFPVILVLPFMLITTPAAYHSWRESGSLMGDIFLCLLSLSLFPALPYFINVLNQSTKRQKFFMALGLLLFLAVIVRCNIFLAALFVLLFSVLYACLWFVREGDVGEQESVYQYLFRKKQYLKITLFIIALCGLIYWIMIVYFDV